jgi:DNA repair exonuclease SbcCD ATPase subunit
MAPTLVMGADEDATAKVKAMLRRTQEALRQAQSDNADLARAKVELDAKLKEATQQLATTRSGLSTAQGSLRAVQGQQADLQTKFDEASTRLTATSSRLAETARTLATREAELATVRQELQQTKTADAKCEDDNAKLYTYGQEILDRYQHKGVWASLRQKEPLFGFRQVEIENVVQEYRLKMADVKVKPAAQ